MSDRLKGKSAVVTGSGRGIGREIALALAGEGASVVVNDFGGATDGTGVATSPADEVVAEIAKAGGKAVANYESVADFEAGERIIRSCVDNFGKIDILVNVAGILRDRMIFNMLEAEWNDVLKVHLYGTFNTCRHACTLMKEQRSGRIINTTSDAWVKTVGHANYGAAKGGIVTFTKSVARELGKYGVTCNAIAPLAATRLTLSEDTIQGVRKRFEAGHITREVCEEVINMPGPEHIAPFVAYLATDDAKDINACVFQVTKGRVALYSEPEPYRFIFKPEGKWTLDELVSLVPKTLTQGIENPAPPRPEK